MELTDLIGWLVIFFLAYRVFAWLRDDLRLWDDRGRGSSGPQYYYPSDTRDRIRPPPPLRYD